MGPRVVQVIPQVALWVVLPPLRLSFTPPPTILLGTLPSTVAFQEMLELLRVSEKTISQKHDELTETCRKTKHARGQQQINSKSLFAISQI